LYTQKKFQVEKTIVEVSGLKDSDLEKPYDSDIDDRPEKYVEGLINEKSKGSAFAEKNWKSVIAFDAGIGSPNSLISAFAYRKLGRSQESERILNEWVQKIQTTKLQCGVAIRLRAILLQYRMIFWRMTVCD